MTTGIDTTPATGRPGDDRRRLLLPGGLLGQVRLAASGGPGRWLVVTRRTSAWPGRHRGASDLNQARTARSTRRAANRPTGDDPTRSRGRTETSNRHRLACEPIIAKGPPGSPAGSVVRQIVERASHPTTTRNGGS